MDWAVVLTEFTAGLQWLYTDLAVTIAPFAFVIALVIVLVDGIQYGIYSVQLVLAGVALYRRSVVNRAQSLEWLYAESVLPISLIATAFNEEETIVESTRSLLDLDYPLYEVIVVNDGSKDETLKRLKDAFGLEPVQRSYEKKLDYKPIRQIYGSRQFPRLVVIDKENGGGKADANNAAIDIARMPLFAATDGNSLLEPDSLLQIVHPFMVDPERVVAAGGTIRVVNDCTVRDGRVVGIRLPKSWIASFQVMEYIRAFLMGRLGWSQLGALTIVSGAFGVFRRDAVVEAGGYRTDCLGEDYELILRLHRHFREKKRDYEIAFVPEPVCWTQVPETFGGLMTQRVRWQRGAMEGFMAHRSMLFNPRYGRVGYIAMGHGLIVDILGPIAEALGYFLIPFFWAIGALDFAWMAAFTSLIFIFGTFISIGSLVLEELELKRFPRVVDLLWLSVLAVAENFGYRQLNNIYRIIGTWQWMRGKRGGWGSIQRKSFGVSAPTTPPNPTAQP